MLNGNGVVLCDRLFILVMIIVVSWYYYCLVFVYCIIIVIQLYSASQPTNATRRNHFGTIFSFLFTEIKKITKTGFSHIFPPEGNFDIDAGDGEGGGPFRTKNRPKF